MPQPQHKIALLGSTGSIGEQTLEIVRAWPESFEITTLTSNNNWQKLAQQAIEFTPDSVVIADKRYYPELREALKELPVKVYAGADAVKQVVAGSGVTVVVNAIVGYAGLEPAVAALEAGKKIALANKESLVVAGELLMKLSKRYNAPIIPVDSEHSAVFQCLLGEVSPVTKIILTASGGPFYDIPSDEMKNVTVEHALRHPTWNMGAKISIDSATMMNKGLEVMEAHWLFGVEPSRIRILIHPQSVIHSMVEFADGSVKAQMSLPDMRLPIQYALTFPQRWEITGEKFNFARCGALTFAEPDYDRFPALRLAYNALEAGGNAGTVLNAANEVAVRAFLERRIGFMQITETIEHTLDKIPFVRPVSIDDYYAIDTEARRMAEKILKN